MTIRLATVLLIALAVVIAAVVILAGPVGAMGWYDAECCSNRDCRPVTAGEVELHLNGWYVVPADETVQFGDWKIKRSKDVNMHICARKVVDGINVICIYIPDPGT